MPGAGVSLATRLREAMGSERAEDLAVRAKVGGRSVQRILAGGQKTAPRLDTVEALAKATGRRPGWLAFGEGDDPDAG